MNENQKLRDHNQALTEANGKYVDELKSYKAQVTGQSHAVI